MEQNIAKIVKKFVQNTDKPELFLSLQSKVVTCFKNSTKELYDLTKEAESDKEKSSDALPELILESFDDEQVWQELELQNEPLLNNLVVNISKLAAAPTISLLENDKQETNIKKLRDKPPKKGNVKPSGGVFESESEEYSDGMDVEDADEIDEYDDDDEGVKSDDDNDDDILDLKKGLENDDYNSDDSAEERFLKELLEKAEKVEGEGTDDDSESEDNEDFMGGMGDNREKDSENEDGSDLDFDFNTEIGSGTSKGKSKKGKSKETDLFLSSKNKSRTSEKSNKGKSLESSKRKRKTVVDDKFFSLADMEAFLEREDMREERKIARERGELKSNKEDEESDKSSSDDENDMTGEDLEMLYQDLPSSEDDENGTSGRDLKYEDFFGGSPEESSQRNIQGTSMADEDNSDAMIDNGESNSDDNDEDKDLSGEEKTKKKHDLFNVDESESEGEDISEVLGGAKSTFEKRQERLKQRITGMEEAALSEKPWQLMGEVAAVSRPLNSLLEEDLEFEQQTKTAPVITEETTKTLEDIIKQRIKDKAFDDVERKEKPKEEAFEYKKRITLDQEKSKISLGEVYEQEYLKQTQEEEDEKDDPKREEIKKMMQSLFIKLDALSNFHYTPKPAQPEVKIINNLPSITMEEVLPVTVSDTALLAPEEIKEKEKHELKGDTEKSKTDKLRARRKKKKKQRVREKANEKKQKLLEKIAPALGNKYAKEKALKELEKQSKRGKGVSVIEDKKSSKKGSLTSSSQFFTQLQEEVTTHIQQKKTLKKKKEKKRQSGANLKL